MVRSECIAKDLHIPNLQYTPNVGLIDAQTAPIACHDRTHLITECGTVGTGIVQRHIEMASAKRKCAALSGIH